MTQGRVGGYPDPLGAVGAAEGEQDVFGDLDDDEDPEKAP